MFHFSWRGSYLVRWRWNAGVCERRERIVWSPHDLWWSAPCDGPIVILHVLSAAGTWGHADWLQTDCDYKTLVLSSAAWFSVLFISRNISHTLHVPLFHTFIADVLINTPHRFFSSVLFNLSVIELSNNKSLLPSTRGSSLFLSWP